MVKGITVKQLIEYLKTQAPNEEVFVWCGFTENPIVDIYGTTIISRPKINYENNN